MEEKKWYVIRCTNGKEKKSKKHIENEIEKQNLNDFVNRIVVPTRKEAHIKNGKKINRDVNYYPGYILIEAILNGDVQHIIKNTQGVINILGNKDSNGKDMPVPLRNDEVVKFLGKVDQFNNEKSIISHGFIVGESVTISDGPFTNFDGVIEEINEEKKKIKVSIKIFGRKTPVELEFSQVKY
jgi:transcriptional antiterminator NusG